MKMAAYAFGAAGILALLCAFVGRVVGDPHLLMGSAIKSWILLSCNLTLLGILAALLDSK